MLKGLASCKVFNLSTNPLQLTSFPDIYISLTQFHIFHSYTLVNQKCVAWLQAQRAKQTRKIKMNFQVVAILLPNGSFSLYIVEDEVKWGQEVLCVVYNVFDAKALASASGMPAI